MAKIPDTYDSLFEEWGIRRGVPPEFLKALSWHESGFKPAARPVDKKGKPISSATGFFQVLKATVELFNSEAKEAHFTIDDMTDPAKATQVGSWLVAKIVKTYDASGAPDLRTDWQDPIYAGLVALGYVAGWSDKQGVAAIGTRLHNRGYTAKLTPGVVAEYARQWYPDSAIYNTGGGYMSDPALLTHVKKIAADYADLITPFKSVAADVVGPNERTKRESKRPSTGMIALVAIGLFFLLAD